MLVMEPLLSLTIFSWGIKSFIRWPTLKNNRDQKSLQMGNVFNEPSLLTVEFSIIEIFMSELKIQCFHQEMSGNRLFNHVSIKRYLMVSFPSSKQTAKSQMCLTRKIQTTVDLFLWIFYFLSVKKMALCESAWDEAMSIDHCQLEYYRWKKCANAVPFYYAPCSCSTWISAWVKGPAFSWTWSHNFQLVLQGGRHSCLFSGGSRLCLSPAGGLSPWHRRSLSLSAHFYFFQSSSLPTFHVLEKNPK